MIMAFRLRDREHGVAGEILSPVLSRGVSALARDPPTVAWCPDGAGAGLAINDAVGRIACPVFRPRGSGGEHTEHDHRTCSSMSAHWGGI